MYRSCTNSSLIWPGFEQPVPSGGYAWWYIDAVSLDRRYALTLIVFIGSVFSPYYRWAIGRGRRPDALDHSSINVALYGAGPAGWAMTERSAACVTAKPDSLKIGPSTLIATPQGLRLNFSERAMPFPRRLAGQIDIHFNSVNLNAFALDSARRHFWWPLAPLCRVDVRLSHPDLCWQGSGYVDSNRGSRPLEHDFDHWNWARVHHTAGATLEYSTCARSGQDQSLYLQADKHGDVRHAERPPTTALARSRWGLVRTMAGKNGDVRVSRSLEDTPFYSRALVDTTVDGQPAFGLHEMLDMNRFKHPCTQLMLPFRMPRWPGRRV